MSDQRSTFERAGIVLDAAVPKLPVRMSGDRSGVPAITPHGVRHTSATLLIRAGANIKIIQARLGHEKIQTTLDLYGHLFDDDQDWAAAVVGTRLYPKDRGSH